MSHRVVATALAVVCLPLVAGCDGTTAAASTRPGPTVTVTAQPDSSRFTLRGVCEHLEETHRDGGQTDLVAYQQESSGLQALWDVSDGRARRALTPLLQAAEQGAAAGSHAGDRRYTEVDNAAFEGLVRTCEKAGYEHGLAADY